MTRRSVAGVALALLLAGPAPIAAQVVRGTLVEAGSRQPVAAALMQLLADGDTIRATAVSNEQGRFATAAVTPGSYRLRALRIGYLAWTSERFSLAAGQVRDDTLAVTSPPVVLDEIVIEANSPCRGSPEADRRMALLWDEARKSLSLARASESEALSFRTILSRWFVDPSGRQAELRRWEVFNQGRWPIVTLPPDSLLRAGFVQPGDTILGPTYYGPDAAVFFSDGFLQTHCFRLVRSPPKSPPLLGLGYEPIRGRPVPDIEGVLWLDPKTTALRRLEYHYSGLWDWVPKHGTGGAIDFGLLRTGQVVITGWEIRAPVARTIPYALGDQTP